MSRKTLFKLDQILLNIEFEEQNLKHEQRLVSVYAMFGSIRKGTESRKIKAKIERLKKDYNDLKLEL